MKEHGIKHNYHLIKKFYDINFYLSKKIQEKRYSK